jgi:hypothetical protein
MHEGDAGGAQFAVFRVDVVDLDRERDPRAGSHFAFIKKDRQIGIVPHRRGVAVGNLEFDSKPRYCLYQSRDFRQSATGNDR